MSFIGHLLRLSSLPFTTILYGRKGRIVYKRREKLYMSLYLNIDEIFYTDILTKILYIDQDHREG